MQSGNLILTGFMGVGKSTVGRLLAAQLGRAFMDTDALIEAWAARPIPAIFAEQGEPAFRAWEVAAARQIAAQQDLVVATGGGLLLNPLCHDLLAASGAIICLTADPAVLAARLSATDRPLLQTADPAARIAELLAQRAAVYARYPQIDTTNRSPADVAAAVRALFDALTADHPPTPTPH